MLYHLLYLLPLLGAGQAESGAEAQKQAQAAKRQQAAFVALQRAEHSAILFLEVGENNRPALFLEGLLAKLHAESGPRGESLRRLTLLERLAQYDTWPRQAGETTHQMLARLSTAPEAAKEREQLTALKQEYLAASDEPWPYDWRSRQDFWLKLAADTVDSAVADQPSQVWRKRIEADPAHARLYRQAYLAVATVRPIKDFDFDLLEPLTDNSSVAATTGELAAILAAAARRNVAADNPRRLALSERLLALLRQEPPSEFEIHLLGQVLIAYYRSETAPQRRRLFDTLLQSSEPPAFRAFCQRCEMSPRQIRAAFYRKQIAWQLGQWSVRTVVKELQEQVALPLWIDPRVLTDRQPIPYDQLVNGPWLHVADAVLAKTPYRLILLDDDIAWIGPPDRQAEAAALLRRARGNLPNASTIAASALRDETPMEFIEAPLSDVLSYCSDFHKLEIEIAAGGELNLEAPVTKFAPYLPLYLGLTELADSVQAEWTAVGDAVLLGSPASIAAWRDRGARHRLHMARLQIEGGPAAQALANRRRIEPEDGPLSKLAQSIETDYQVECKFVGDADSIRRNQERGIDTSIDSTVGLGLTIVLARHNLEWDAQGKTIFIGSREAVQQAQRATERADR
jgi:hypothetical protein